MSRATANTKDSDIRLARQGRNHWLLSNFHIVHSHTFESASTSVLVRCLMQRLLTMTTPLMCHGCN